MKRLLVGLLTAVMVVAGVDLSTCEVYAARKIIIEVPEDDDVAEPVVESKQDQVVIPVEEPKQEEVVKPAEEPKQEEVVKPAEEPKQEEVVKPAEEPKQEEVVKPAEEPKQEEVVKPAEEPKQEEVVKPAEEPKQEEIAEPIEEPSQEQVTEPAEKLEQEKGGEIVEDTEQEQKIEPTQATEQKTSEVTIETYQIRTKTGNIEVNGAYLEDKTAEFMQMVNDYRVKNGLDALPTNDTMTKIARERAVQCSVRFDHTLPFATYTSVCDYYDVMAENIATGSDSMTVLFDALKASSGHNANMLCDYSCGGFFTATTGVAVFERVIDNHKVYFLVQVFNTEL